LTKTQRKKLFKIYLAFRNVVERISRELASFEEVSQQIESILGVLYKNHNLLKPSQGNSLREKRASTEYNSFEESQLQKEYVRLVYYSHMVINSEYSMPYVRNGKLFDWHDFNKQTE
jgi:DNA/RNA endonuclease YhcR with UshA esterase domain